MLTIEIPGRDTLAINHVVLDYNGTIAVDGKLFDAARARINELCKSAAVYVLTADIYGTVKAQCVDMDITVKTFPRDSAAVCKEAIVKELGKGVVCIGNGYNDMQMFDAADLSIAILEAESACAGLISHADVLVRSADEGFGLLLKPDRLRATLRT